MALMDKPTTTPSDDQVDTDQVVSLDEDGNPEMENQEYLGLISYIGSAYKDAKDHRRMDEERWTLGDRNSRGI